MDFLLHLTEIKIMGRSTSRRQFVKLCSLALPAAALPMPTNFWVPKNYSMKDHEFEVIIIGGSYAGLSAALTLGRSLRKTLVIDAGKPCNRQTPHSHNFLTQDGHTPQQITSVAKAQVSKYHSITFYDGMATMGKKINGRFEVTTSEGAIFKADKLVFAAGIKDMIPNIAGFAECWGISVVHCPYCHGFEIRHKKTALIANGERAFHLGALVHNLTKDVTILTSGTKQFEEDQLEKLHHHNLNIVEKEIATIEHTNGQMETITFKDGSSEKFDCAYAAIPFEQNSSIPKELGCHFTEQGHIEVNFMQKTSVEGIYACGDNSSMMRSVATAVYTGNIVGAALNNELTMESF